MSIALVTTVVASPSDCLQIIINTISSINTLAFGHPSLWAEPTNANVMSMLLHELVSKWTILQEATNLPNTAVEETKAISNLDQTQVQLAVDP